MKLMNKLEHLLDWGGIRRDVIFLIISGLSLLASIFDLFPLPFDAAWIAIILCGIPIILEAVIGLVTAFDIKADVLVSLALIASILIGEDFAAGEVAFIMQLGGLLEELTVARARAGIEKLVHLTPQTARIIFDGSEQMIPAEKVKINDVLRVLPGETIPVDGIILSGQTSINQAVMTGESLPVDKAEGDEVFSGTVNQFGAFLMKASKVGEDSSIQRMIRLVQSADAGKAKIVGLADRWATWIVVIALTAAVLTWLATGEVIRSVTILVVFCPCALVLATPTAIMAAIGNATGHGLLVREGDALERLASVSRMTFDKTGTLTYGTPEVTGMRSFLPEISTEKLYAWAAGAELRSEHPPGKAVIRCFRSQGKEIPEAERFEMLPGRGVLAVLEGKRVLAGNQELLTENGILLTGKQLAEAEGFSEQGCTIIYLAAEGEAAGFLALSDTLRPEAADMLKKLEKTGVTPVLLTGDHEHAARHIAESLSITEVHWGCLPEDKLNYIDQCQKEQKKVCMIGDGINDSPALSAANVGIAISDGAQLARQIADVTISGQDLHQILFLKQLSDKLMKRIAGNYRFIVGFNSALILLGVFGILPPASGALLHNTSTLAIGLKSMGNLLP